MAIIFTDLRGFSELTDHTAPERITLMLNQYFTEMVSLNEKYGATLDKIIGDGIMAFLGAPEDMLARAQAVNAVYLGVAMQKKLNELNHRWQAAGLVNKIKMRIGIHQEEVTIGNFGSKDLMTYTAIGGGVNLAKRLESSCTPGKIMVSLPIYEVAKNVFPFGDLQEREFKGILQAPPVAEIDPNAI